MRWNVRVVACIFVIDFGTYCFYTATAVCSKERDFPDSENEPRAAPSNLFLLTCPEKEKKGEKQ